MDQFILLLKENPVISALLLIAPVIGIAWKVFHELYVKPRDFRIESLRDDLNRLTTQLEKVQNKPNPALSSLPTPTLQSEDRPANSVSTLTAIGEPASPQPRVSVEALVYADAGDPLTNLAEMVKQWKDPQLTDLQKQAFEKKHHGKDVKWIVRFESVSEVAHGLIASTVVDATYEGVSIFGPSALALFPEREASKLLAINKGDVVTVRGRVREFFLSPVIESAVVELVIV